MDQQQLFDEILEIKAEVKALRAVLEEGRPAKECLSTAELAEALGKAEYTCREWCRKSLIPAQKKVNGRGWIISREVLLRIQRGELPIPEHQVVNGKAIGGLQQKRRHA